MGCDGGEVGDGVEEEWSVESAVEATLEDLELSADFVGGVVLEIVRVGGPR